jgi:hypothetical protein
MRKFAWYGRLSTKDKQDPDDLLSLTAQRMRREGRGAGRPDRLRFHRPGGGPARRPVGWAELIREAKEPDARRFDAVIVYSTSRALRLSPTARAAPRPAPSPGWQPEEIEAAIAQLDHAQRNGDGFDPHEAVAIIDCLPDLTKPPAEADPELRHAIFDAFNVRVEIDRNLGESK